MFVATTCPYCGQPGEIDVEPGDLPPGEQVWVQDCEVCCRPWTVRAYRDYDGELSVSVERD